jgi:GTP-binding protein
MFDYPNGTFRGKLPQNNVEEKMKGFIFKQPLFIKSAVNDKDYPVLRNPEGTLMPEIAVAGRSNVGKSSLLNDLFQRKGLVKTSSTPGKTQMLNFFTLNERLAFVDLPGYGYAEVPTSVRKQWGPMVQTYLNRRETLKLVLCLFDIRRTPNEEDKQLLEWAVKAEKAIILVLTKVDKVNANEKKSNTAKILKSFNYENLHVVHYSTTKNVGRKELVAMLNDALNEGT